MISFQTHSYNRLFRDAAGIAGAAASGNALTQWWRGSWWRSDPSAVPFAEVDLAG